MSGEPAGDFHNHLVPAVDDGSNTLEDALDGLHRMTASGIMKIVTTPHIDASLLSDGAASGEYLELVGDGFRKLAGLAGERFPGLDFRRGHEVRLDVLDCDLGDERVRLGGTSFVLVEWPRFQVPPGSVEVLSRLRASGVRPVVAHPERYHGIENGLPLLDEWRRVGAYLQLTYGSLVGRYGTDVRMRAFALLKAGLADYLATDFHGRPEYRLYKVEASVQLEELGAAGQLHLLSITNPAQLFGDEAPVPVPPLNGSRSSWGRIREISP